MHGLPVIVPVPELVKLTAPNGADFEPESVSDTFAVQVVVSSSGNDAGAQPVTVVEVERVVTVTAKPDVSALFVCRESLAA